MSANFYESNKAVSEYLLFHYGDDETFLLNGIGPREALGFARRCGGLWEGVCHNFARALDLGCAVGRSSFELSKQFKEVIGIDFAQALIDGAIKMQEEKSATIPVAEEGEVTRDIEIALDSVARPERVGFRQGDAMNLPSELGQFDFMLMANLIDRLPNPRACLEGIHNWIAPDGILAITSPYTWLEEFTPKALWLGGYYENGQPVRALDSLKEILQNHFALLDTKDMPFLIREHARKNQYSIAQATIWKRVN